MSWFRAVAVALVWLVSVAPAWAHHGVANFDLNKEITISGTVTRIDLVNPHSWLFLDVAGEDGRVVPWRCELRGATVLRRSGWSPEMFKAGTTITITGAPDRFEPNTCYLGSALFADGTRVDRYGQLSRPAAAAAAPVERPLRHASGAPNLAGDWAAEQRVMTDPRGMAGAFLPIGVARASAAGQRAGRHAGLPGHARHGRVARRRSDRRLLEPSERAAPDRRGAEGHRRIRRRVHRQSPAAMRADQHPLRLGVRDRREPHRAERRHDHASLRIDGARADDSSERGRAPARPHARPCRPFHRTMGRRHARRGHDRIRAGHSAGRRPRPSQRSDCT